MTDFCSTRQRTSTKEHKKRWPYLLLSILAGLLVLQVVVSNQLTTAGYDISNIEKEIYELKTENNSYEEKIASASSLLTLRQKAVDMGFTKQVKPLYLSHDAQVALLK